jgi:hypothetical protein
VAPASSYPMGTGGSFPTGVKLTTHLHLVPRFKKRLHGEVLGQAQGILCLITAPHAVASKCIVT